MDEWQLEQLDAVIQTAVLGAYADDELADEERAVLRECIATHAETEQQARIMFAFADRLPRRVPPLNSAARNARLEEIKTVLTTKEERESAFSLAVTVANAHEGISVRESAVLLQLLFDLEIDPAFARQLMATTAAQAKGKRYDAGRRILPERERAGGNPTLKSSDTHAPEAVRPLLAQAERGVPAVGNSAHANQYIRTLLSPSEETLDDPVDTLRDGATGVDRMHTIPSGPPTSSRDVLLITLDNSGSEPGTPHS